MKGIFMVLLALPVALTSVCAYGQQGNINVATCKDYLTAYTQTGQIQQYEAYAEEIFNRMNEQKVANGQSPVDFGNPSSAMSSLAGLCHDFVNSNGLMVNGGSFHDAVMSLYGFDSAG